MTSVDRDKQVKGRDHADEAVPVQDRESPILPHARKVEPLKEGEKPDQLQTESPDTRDRQEALVDEAVDETFTASDPIAPKRIT